jgi:hypothetical protein
MFLFTFTMLLFLTDARPSNKLWPGIEEYNNVMDYDGNNRFVNERRPRTLTRLPEFLLWEYEQRYFRQ